MKTRLLKFYIFLLLFALSHSSNAQQASGTGYYYDYFEYANQTAFNANWPKKLSGAATVVISTASPLTANGGSTSLASVRNTTSPNSVSNTLTSTGATSLNSGSVYWEWSLQYKYNSTTNLTDVTGAAMTAATKNAWKFWLFADSDNPATCRGYYITQKGSNIVLVEKNNTDQNGTPPGPLYDNVITSSLGMTAGVTYNIKIQRVNTGSQISWRMYIAANSTEANNVNLVGSNNEPRNSNVYYTGYVSSILESVTNDNITDNYFQWDDVKMYTRTNGVVSNNTTQSGVIASGTSLYVNEPDVVLYSFGITDRTVLKLTQVDFSVTGGPNPIFNNVRLIKSLDPYYSTSGDNVQVGSTLNNLDPTTSFTGVNDYIAGSPGPANSLPTVVYYFLVVNVKTTTTSSNFQVTLSGLSSNDNNYGPLTSTSGAGSNTAGAVGKVYDWVGGSGVDYNWGTATNWVPSTPAGGPTSADLARIATNYPFVSTPVVNATATAGNIIMGTVGASSSGITVNSTLTVSGDITYQSDNSSAGANPPYVAFLNTTGTGTVNANSLNIIANSPLTYNYTEKLTSSVTNLNLNNNISLTTSLTLYTGNPNFLHHATFVLTGGTAKVNGIIQTTNVTGTTSPISTVSVVPSGTATLQLANTTALSGLSTLGNNVISFKNTGATVEYLGSSIQTVYTDANITGLTGGVSYQNIKFSGTGVKTPNGGNLNVAGDFTNNSGSSSNLVLSTTPVIFNGTTAQTLSNASGSTTLFNNVTFQNAGTKTMSGSGNFNVGSTGTVTMAANTSLAAGGVLTLKSNSSGTGRVDKIPATAQITGNVTVERWFTGGSLSNRGWRLMSSPVANSTGTYNFSSLQTNLYITGSGAGFDPSPANGATVLLYDNPNKKLIVLPSVTTPVKVGSGFYFYFRGNKTDTTGKFTKTGSPPAYAKPEANVVGLQSGTLNQQGITYTLSNAGNGFNLVGNPYASTITLPSGGSGSSAPYTGTTGFVYTYTSGANSVFAEPLAVNIASGQGFYVKSTSSTSSIAFTESLKSTAQVTSGLLLGKPVGTELPILSIKMVQDSANYDIAHLRFLDTYKAEYDENEDADDFNGSGQNTFLGVMTADNHLVAIASQPLDKKRTSVFLNVNDNYSGLYTIKKMNLSGIPAVYDVWLMDHFKSDSLDLRANDTYNFNLDKANPLTFGATRFEIVIRKKSLPPYELISFNGQRTGTDIVLKWNTANEYDYTSFELQRSADGINFEAVRNIQSSSQGAYNFKDIYSSNNTATIYYRLKQVDINDVVYYSNIVIITPAKGNGTFAIFPNPATNTIQFSLDQTLKSPSVRLSIFNTMGLLMKSSNFTATTGQQDVSTLIPGNYTIEITDLNSKKAILTGKFIKL